MDNQRAIQLLQAHIDEEDMPLFSQAAAMGIRALERVATLEAELAEARKDGERLDWLESLQLHEGIFGHSMQGRDLLCRSGDWTCGNNVLGGWFNGKTPRAAIDAARAAEGGKG